MSLTLLGGGVGEDEGSGLGDSQELILLEFLIHTPILLAPPASLLVLGFGGSSGDGGTGDSTATTGSLGRSGSGSRSGKGEGLVVGGVARGALLAAFGKAEEAGGLVLGHGGDD